MAENPDRFFTAWDEAVDEAGDRCRPGIRAAFIQLPGKVTDDAHLSPGQCHARTASGGQPLPDPACTPGASPQRMKALLETAARAGSA